MQSPESRVAEFKAGPNNETRNETSKIVLPDECGDSLWDEVLKESPNLTTVLDKPTDSILEEAAVPKENVKTD